MPDNLVLEDLEIYKLAIDIGEDVWAIVSKWEHFNKRTIGCQLVDAVDSVAANIAEGYGRFYFRERKTFCYYSRGSLLETKTWLTKAFKRGIISKVEYDSLILKLQTRHHKLNAYIKKLKHSIENETE